MDNLQRLTDLKAKLCAWRDRIEKKYFDVDTYKGSLNVSLLAAAIAILAICHNLFYWKTQPGQEKYSRFELEKGKIYIVLFAIVMLLNVLRIFLKRRGYRFGGKSPDHRSMEAEQQHLRSKVAEDSIDQDNAASTIQSKGCP